MIDSFNQYTNLTMATNEKLLTVKELSEALGGKEAGFSIGVVTRLYQLRKIPYYKIGDRKFRFDLDRVLEAIKRREVKAVN
jgi:hypothetical protein